jgi:hypothetical protein
MAHSSKQLGEWIDKSGEQYKKLGLDPGEVFSEPVPVKLPTHYPEPTLHRGRKARSDGRNYAKGGMVK